MTPTFLDRYLLIVAVIVAGVGTVDAAGSRDWDLFTLFVLLDAILLTLLVRTGGRRPGVPVRADLAIWLRRRAATHGETVGATADRAVASYRERLEPVEERKGG